MTAEGDERETIGSAGVNIGSKSQGRNPQMREICVMDGNCCWIATQITLIYTELDPGVRKTVAGHAP